MSEELRPDDENLIEKLLAIAPGDRQAVLNQIMLDWEPDRLWQAVTEWLLTSMRMETSPSNDLAINLGRARERLDWVVHRAPVTRATPEAMALAAQKSRSALVKKGADKARRAANARRHDDGEKWKAIAREEAAKLPMYKTKRRVEDVINDKLKKLGLEPKGGSTIRNAIKGYRPK